MLVVRTAGKLVVQGPPGLSDSRRVNELAGAPETPKPICTWPGVTWSPVIVIKVPLTQASAKDER